MPDWPLPTQSARERKVWLWVWRTPQAAAWATEPWRHPVVAMYVRLSVRCEARDASSALHAQLHRYGNQIGMTPTGLRDNRWEIEEVPGANDGVRRETTPPPTVPPTVPPPSAPLRSRLTVVSGARPTMRGTQ